MIIAATILGGLAGLGIVIWIDVFYEQRQLIKDLQKEINQLKEENGWAQK